MSSAGSFGDLVSNFDQRLDRDPSPRHSTPSATASTPKRVGDAVGPIQAVQPRAFATPPPPTSSEPQRDDLNAACGILVGVLIGSLAWALIAGLIYLLPV